MYSGLQYYAGLLLFAEQSPADDWFMETVLAVPRLLSIARLGKMITVRVRISCEKIKRP